MRLRFAASAAVALLLLATVGSALPSPPQLTKGTLEDGVYHHTATGTDIRLPAGWLIMGDSDSSGGEAVMLRDSAGQSYSVWMISSSIPVANIPAALEPGPNTFAKLSWLSWQPSARLEPHRRQAFLAAKFRVHGNQLEGNSTGGVCKHVIKISQTKTLTHPG
jgi:hypothetical protein